MRPVIKKERECSYHRSEAFEIGSPPPLSGAGEDMSERPRRQPSASSLRSLRRPLSRLPFRRSAWCYAPSLPPFRFRLFAFAPSLRLPLVDASEMSSSRRRTSAAPIPASWPATALQSPHGTPPRLPNTKKGDGIPSPSGCQTATLPVQRPRFRASSYPTPWPLP